MKIDPDKLTFAIPSKGRMGKLAIEFLTECGFKISRKNRDYIGTISGFPKIHIIFQNQTDIIQGVENGSLDFGIAGYDLLCEQVGLERSNVIIIHDNLEFGGCNLEIAIPESWEEDNITELFRNHEKLRIATKFPNVTNKFLAKYDFSYKMVPAKGALEVYPALDYCDIIIDLVSTGETLSANRLKQINGGKILKSQAIFIGNRATLKNSENLETARQFLEYFEAHLRGKRYFQIFANMKESDPIKVKDKLFEIPELHGLQGPTISPVYTKNGEFWNAVHIIVEKSKLHEVIKAIRTVGGSGVVVSPATYIFDEEPECYTQLIKKIEEN